MPPRRVRHSGLWLVLITPLFAGCSSERTSSSAPTYDGEVSAILASKCIDCHRDAANGGWTATNYLTAIACVRTGEPATLPADDTAPIARAIADSTHYLMLTDGERETVRAWIRAGAPKFQTSVHDPAFVDPRADKSHARMLRAERWKSMLDATADSACGRCHDGTPSGRSAKVTTSAPGATSCTTCHNQPGGVLACSTCHGDGTRAAPPRNPCFFPDDVPKAGAHVAHVGPNAVRGVGLPCSTCHPTPSTGADLGAATHANGTVDVVFDTAIAGPNATYDKATNTCTNACHARAGAAKPKPAWTDKGPLACGDCHGAPPPQHYAGACTSCHKEADATGTALKQPVLHLNGKVDLGDGSGKCGSCHGTGDDPWPMANGAHGTHRAPPDAKAVACDNCHVVPTAFGTGTGHPHGGPAQLTFSGTATARGAQPSYVGGTCNQVYCHGAGLVGTTAKQPVWTDTSGKSKQCDGCHSTPPDAPHPTSSSCWSCHPSVIDPGPNGKPVVAQPQLHVNGETNK